MSAQEKVADYMAAWAETDHAKRRAVLERCWAPDGVYLDPLGRAEGRDGFAEHIGGFHERFPGHRLEVSSGVDEHDGYLRFAWMMRDPDGAVVLEGVDFGELDADGAIRSIVGFFGPWPPLP
jgi:hypothetical protein